MFCYFLCRLVYDEYVIREYPWPAVVYEYAGGAAGDLCQATISSLSQYDPSTQRRGRNGTSGVRSTNQVATMCVMNMHLALWVWIWRSGWLDTVDSEGDGGFRIWGASTRIFFGIVVLKMPSCCAVTSSIWKVTTHCHLCYIAL